MADRLMVAVAVLLWVIVVWRAPSLRRPGPPRTLWLVLVTLACAQQLQVLSVYRAVECQLGVPGGAACAKHAFALVAAACVRALVGLDAGEELSRFRRVGLPGLTLALMVVPFLLWPPRVLPAALAHRAEFYGPGAGVVIPWAAFLAYACWALGSAARLCWRHRSQAASRPLRHGLEMIAVGSTVGFAYVGLKVAVEASWVVGRPGGLVAGDAAAEAYILGVAITLCAVGASLEAVVDTSRRALHDVQAVRSLRRLSGLRLAVGQAAPHVQRLPRQGLRTRMRLGTAGSRLLQVQLEIEEGLLYLQPYATPGVRAQALGAAELVGLTGERAAAAAEAVWLAHASRSKLAGDPPAAGQTWDGPGGQPMQDQARWLTVLAAAHRDRRQLRRLTAATAAAGAGGRPRSKRGPE